MKKAIITVVLAAFCALCFYSVRYINSPVHTIEAKLKVNEQTVRANAIFVRDEKVYKTDTSGTVYNHYAEGTRVKAGTLVSTVYNGAVNEQTMQELRTIDRKIANITSNGEYNQVYDTSSVSAESIIEDYKLKIIEAGEKGKVPSVAAYKEIVNDIRSGKNSQTASGIIADLNRQKTEVENRIGGNKYPIYSENSGIFTTVLDGLEDYLTPERAMTMSVSEFKAIKVNEAETVATMVEAGTDICKISNNHEWYVLLCAPADEMKNHEVGDEVEVRFDSIPGEQVKCKISNISPEEDGNILVLLMSNHYLEGAYSFRRSDATIVLESYTGYEVPIHALRVENNVQGIIGEKNNEQKFYPCKVLYTNTKEGYVIVNDTDGENDLIGIDRIVVGER